MDSQLSLVKHSDLDHLVTIRIASFQGSLPARPLVDLLDHPALQHHAAQQAAPPDLAVHLELWADNNRLLPPLRTPHRAFRARSHLDWNLPLTLPLKYRDLPLSAQLAITVYHLAGPRQPAVVGGSTLRLFGPRHTLRRGKQRLYLWPGTRADGRTDSDTPSTRAAPPLPDDEMGRLEQLVRRHERGDIPRLDWLDKLAFRQIEHIHQAESEKSPHLFLYVDLPRFDFPVVFSEPEYPLPVLSSHTLSSAFAPVPSPATASTSLFGPTASEPALFTIVDPEIVRKNPVEAKHRRLVRDHRNGPLDRELKPNAKIRDQLNEILRYPPTQELTTPQRDLVWKFRFYLTRDKRALTKFLKSVVWSDPGEATQAVETLLPLWGDVEMDDALELLGPAEGFRDRRVRAYAVKQLERADDEELMLYLLQLVQALKFEPAPPPASPLSSSAASGVSPSASLRHSHLRHSILSASAAATGPALHSAAPPAPPPANDHLQPHRTLQDFLVERSAHNPVLGNTLFWYLQVERQDKIRGKLFEDVLRQFERRLKEVQRPGEPDQVDVLRRQSEFIARITQLASSLRLSKDSRPKKIEKLRAALASPASSSSGLGPFVPPIPLPLDARISITGIDPEASSVFKSNLFPLRLQLLTSSSATTGESESESEPFPVIFKNGDDLRQDQLVLQLFTLMDRLLRKENLDLKLTPYRVLATGPHDGLVQFVPSRTLQDITHEFGAQGLLGYLRQSYPDPGSVGTYGVRPDVLDTYIRSCAGYCVVTYLLGVGDRHLDNLLLSPDGHFFHVDFGYILGRDPKPFPPAVKVCKEMVDALGGIHSPHYARFKSLSFTGFTTLRKNANLLINLVALMVEADVPDIRVEPDKAVMKVQDKFLLALSEDEAIHEFEALLNDTSYFTSVLDRIHSVAQYWRA